MDLSIIYLIVGVITGIVLTTIIFTIYNMYKKDQLEINTGEVDYNFAQHIQALDFMIETIVDKITLYSIVTKPGQNKVDYVTGVEFEEMLAAGCKELLETVSDAYREVLFRYYDPNELDRVMCEKLKVSLLTVCTQKNLGGK